MNERDAFYAQRDRRTTEYIGAAIPQGLIRIEVGDNAVTTASGQLALLALANQVVRVHRCVQFCLPTNVANLLINVPFGKNTFNESLETLVSTIDPYGEFEFERTSARAIASIGLGHDVKPDLNFYIGADLSIACLGTQPQPFDPRAGSQRGGALTACLGAAAIFRRVLGLDVRPTRLSVWNYRENDEAAYGPEDLQPVNVGSALLVGAGAVGSAVAYWLNVFRVLGSWTVVDRDRVELHNTNRSLTFVPEHAGWPSGDAAFKADTIANLLPNATVHKKWFDECSNEMEMGFDLVLALANDREVRHGLMGLNASISLQGTTGRNWTSHLHRHILGKDDCIWCRTGEIAQVRFGCSTVPIIASDGIVSDAALPFLSAASGLMVVTALQRLQVGELETDDANDWCLDFSSSRRLTRAGVRRCRTDCTRVYAPHIRTAINATRKWRHLDPAFQND